MLEEAAAEAATRAAVTSFENETILLSRWIELVKRRNVIDDTEKSDMSRQSKRGIEL